jgi:hypothetical protein
MNKYRFLYFLVNSDNLSYYINNGVLAKSSTPVPLKLTPDGYKEQALTFVRNSTYFSIFRSFSIPLRFVVDGARILRELLYKKGYEENIYLIILRENTTTGRHEGFYKGELDLSKFQDSLNFFQVNASEGGLTKFIKAFESTSFEVPLKGQGILNLGLNGLMLHKKFVYAIIDGKYGFQHTIGMSFAYEEGTSFNILSGSSFYDGNPIDLANDDDRWILKNIGNDTVTPTISGPIIFKNPATQDIALFIQKSNGDIIYLYPFTTIGPGSYTLSINQTFTVNPHERIYVGGLSSFGNLEIQATQLEISFNTRYRDTVAPIINLEDLGDRIIKQMAGNDYSLVSPLLRNCGVYATCGDALRGFTDAKIKTTFKDYFTNVNRNLNVGLSIKDKTVYIKAKKDYYTSDVIYSLGLVKDVSFELAEEFIFNNLKIGYPNETYDDVNGRDEFNQTQEYKTEITRIAKTLDLTGSWKAGPYAIEFARINLQGKTTTDASSDNDNFLIDVELQQVSGSVRAVVYGTPLRGILIQSTDIPAEFIAGKSFYLNGSTLNNQAYTIKSVSPDITGGFFIDTAEQTTAEAFQGQVIFNNAILRRKVYDSITGVLNPQAQFNIELSPKRLLLNHAGELRSMLWMQDNKKLTFQTTNKNAELKTTLAGVTIEEKADVVISKLGTHYFIPILAKFETIVPEALSTIMEASSTGVFSFEYRGNTYKGYCMEAKQKPSDDEAQEWTLLLSADNDIKNIIH